MIKHAELKYFDNFRNTVSNINISQLEYTISKKEDKINNLSELIGDLREFLDLEKRHFTGRWFRDE